MKTRKPTATTSPADELYTDALDAARRLKKKHGRYFRMSPQDFRRQVRTAHSRIFRRKPGPKGDARIARAACERASGIRWEDLTRRYLQLPATVSELTRAAAEEGLRRKVNRYMQRHPQLRRKWAKKIRSQNSRRESETINRPLHNSWTRVPGQP